jgi:transcriptional regulator with XRE-family HTH domain
MLTELEKLRKKAGLSQMELAAQSKVSQKTISAIEVGRHKQPTYETAMKLANALKVKPETFFKEVVEIEKPKSALDRIRAKIK